MSTYWLAGLAKADITPPAGLLMSGFVARDKPAEGTHDRLWARCLSLSDGAMRAVLVILDMIGVDLHLAAQIRKAVAEFGCVDPHAVAVLATHTHGGPAVLRNTLLGQTEGHYLSKLVNAAAAAVVQAVNLEQPAVLRYHVGCNRIIAYNRREPDGVIDPDLPVLRIESPDGKLFGLLTSYACHPVTLGPNNLLWTADYPGELITTLEQLYPGALAMFATGCCGQINMGHSTHDSITGRGLAQRSFSESQRIGRILAGGVLVVSESMAPPGGKGGMVLTPKLKVSRRLLELPLSRPPSPGELQAYLENWKTALGTLDPTTERGLACLLRANIRWAKTVATQPRREVPAEVMAIAIGELSLALYPGEMFVEYGLDLKQRYPSRHIMTLAYANAAPGYIPYTTAFAKGGYEVEEAYRFYGLPAPLVPQAGEMIQTAMLTLIQQA